MSLIPTTQNIDLPDITAEIDWGSPYIKPPGMQADILKPGLVAAMTFQNVVKDFTGVMLPFGKQSFISTGGGTKASLGVYRGRQAIDCSVSGACVNFDTTYSLPIGTNVKSYSCAALLYYPLPQSLSGVYGDKNTSLYYSGTTLFFLNGSITHDPASVSEGWHRLTATGSSTTTAKLMSFYLDGVFIGSTSTSSSINLQQEIAGVGNLNIALNRDRGIQISDFFFWNGIELTAGSVMNHNLNPWGMLRQRRKTIFLAASNVISLINPTETNIQQTTATVGATSDTALGTLYAYVKAGTSPTTPSTADMISGTGAAYHGTDSTPVAGPNTFSATGLTAGTDYHTFTYQVNGADDSNILDSGVWATQVAYTPYRAAMRGGFNIMSGGMSQ